MKRREIGQAMLGAEPVHDSAKSKPRILEVVCPHERVVHVTLEPGSNHGRA